VSGTNTIKSFADSKGAWLAETLGRSFHVAPPSSEYIHCPDFVPVTLLTVMPTVALGSEK
jgi:hypothetical protein